MVAVCSRTTMMITFSIRGGRLSIVVSSSSHRIRKLKNNAREVLKEAEERDSEQKQTHTLVDCL